MLKEMHFIWIIIRKQENGRVKCVEPMHTKDMCQTDVNLSNTVTSTELSLFTMFSNFFNLWTNPTHWNSGYCINWQQDGQTVLFSSFASPSATEYS